MACVEVGSPGTAGATSLLSVTVDSEMTGETTLISVSVAETVIELADRVADDKEAAERECGFSTSTGDEGIF